MWFITIQNLSHYVVSFLVILEYVLQIALSHLFKGLKYSF